MGSLLVGCRTLQASGTIEFWPSKHCCCSFLALNKSFCVWPLLRQMAYLRHSCHRKSGEVTFRDECKEVYAQRFQAVSSTVKGAQVLLETLYPE
jgi:hypothetical protein